MLAIILKLVDLAQAGVATAEHWQQIRARIEAMVAQNRDPTIAEWNALFDEIDADSAALDAASKRLNPKA